MHQRWSVVMTAIQIRLEQLTTGKTVRGKGKKLGQTTNNPSYK